MRWEICLNLSLLRLLSFGLDLHWRGQQAQPAQQAQQGSAAAQQPQQGRLGHLGLREDQAVHTAQHAQQQAQHDQQEQYAQQGQQPQGAPGACSKAQHAQQAQHAGRQARWRTPQEAAARQRQVTPLPSLDDYGLVTFLAYVFYPPLYLAGPIMTYQDFAWQLKQPAELESPQVNEAPSPCLLIGGGVTPGGFWGPPYTGSGCLEAPGRLAAGFGAV
jgi:hypothetical protein